MKPKKSFLVNFSAFAVFAVVVAVLGTYLWSTEAVTFNSRGHETVQGSDDPLLVIAYRGGLCADGVCSQEKTIYQNGEVSTGARLTDTELKQLNTLIEQWDPSQLVIDGNAFCQSYVDGMDTSIRLPTSPRSDEEYTFCHYKNSQEVPLFSFITYLDIDTPEKI